MRRKRSHNHLPGFLAIFGGILGILVTGILASGIFNTYSSNQTNANTKINYVVNGGFDLWDGTIPYISPQNWHTVHPSSIDRSTDKYGGTYSLVLSEKSDVYQVISLPQGHYDIVAYIKSISGKGSLSFDIYANGPTSCVVKSKPSNYTAQDTVWSPQINQIEVFQNPLSKSPCTKAVGALRISNTRGKAFFDNISLTKL